jgi:dTDP-glucose 4,6-dehydratase
VISRSANNYGPRQDRTKLIPKFITNLLKGKKVPLYASGEHVRAWIYVEDNIWATDLVFRNGRLGQIYNIGSTDEFTNLEITRMLLSSLGKTDEAIEFVADRPGHDFRYALSSEKMRNEFEWFPTISFAEGLKRTIAFYTERM